MKTGPICLIMCIILANYLLGSNLTQTLIKITVENLVFIRIYIVSRKDWNVISLKKNVFH